MLAHTLDSFAVGHDAGENGEHRGNNDQRIVQTSLLSDKGSSEDPSSHNQAHEKREDDADGVNCSLRGVSRNGRCVLHARRYNIHCCEALLNVQAKKRLTLAVGFQTIGTRRDQIVRKGKTKREGWCPTMPLYDPICYGHGRSLGPWLVEPATDCRSLDLLV